jgi:molecular chaperone GrpE
MTDPGANRPPGQPSSVTTAPQEAATSTEELAPTQERAPTEERTGMERAGAQGTSARSSGAPPAERSDAAEFEDRWRRAAADLDNLRKRYARELGRERSAERELVTTAFLPVLDTIDRALEHADADPRSIAEGVRSLRDQALAVVEGLGYSREDAAGVPFDPVRHEVVGVVDSDATGMAPGSVAQVLRPGYGAPGRQLRPASVTVAQHAGD